LKIKNMLMLLSASKIKVKVYNLNRTPLCPSNTVTYVNKCYLMRQSWSEFILLQGNNPHYANSLTSHDLSCNLLYNKGL